MDVKGYYLLLQVPENASYLEIKRAYRKLVKKYHPDKNHLAKSDERIKLINEAFEILSDKEKRRVYDGGGYDDEKVDNIEAAHDYFTSVVYPTQSGINEISNTDSKKLLTTNHSIDIPRSRYHISIEPGLCLAFGGCEAVAPKVFTVDKIKRINPKASIKSEAGEPIDKILTAAQVCPTKAIKIIDRYTGYQIYP
jgi:molecular chaperone DnaJ